MSRNGPIGHAGIKLPMRGHPAEDPHTTPPTGQPQWPPQYAEPPARQGQHHPEPQAQRPQYPEPPPQQGQQQPPPGYYFPQAAPEPDPNYGHAQQPPGQVQHPPFNRFPPPPAQDYQPPQQHAQQHAQPVPSWGQQPDPRGYDLGSYMPAPNQGYAQAEPGNYQQAPEPAHFQPAHDPSRMGAPQQGYAESDADFDEMLAEDEEEPRRGRRGLMIVAALVGAIGLGGAMAYTYKTLIAPSGGRAPLIKVTDFGPNKVKADGTDGKAFAHTDKKLLNRLGDDGSQPRAAAAPASNPDPQDERASDDPNAPRKVRIIPIPPAGSTPAPMMAPSAPPPLTANAPMVTVPGLMIENAGPPPQMPPSAARVQVPQQLPPARAVPQPPVVASIPPAALPPAHSAAPVKKAPVAAAPALPKKKPVPKTNEAPAPKPTVTGTSGYVAVLASKTSRMDALKAFADLQQKYGDVLASKTPDVQEANLGDKGVRYRSVVGPPGSKDAASAVCKQLKTAGYPDCWVTAY